MISDLVGLPTLGRDARKIDTPKAVNILSLRFQWSQNVQLEDASTTSA